MANNDATKPLGRLVASFLAASWHIEPPALEFSRNDFETITPLLLKSGAGALGWWRIRHADLRERIPAEELHAAYQLHSIQSVIHRAELEEVVSRLNASGIEPVLVKGWAIARLYPEEGLRPYGDIDLCLMPEQYRRAAEILESINVNKAKVDLHEGFGKLDRMRADDLLDKSETNRIGGAQFRILGCEDQLRILCTHFLRHGAWRPLWLCDIGVVLESRPSEFDWARCFGNDKNIADWVACAIGLAHKLLGARVDDTPVGRRATHLPGWLLKNVLKNWSQPFPELYPPLSYVRPMREYLSHPRGLLKTLRTRWPDPIEATIRLRGPFNEMPRFPFQLGNALWRIGRFLSRTQ